MIKRIKLGYVLEEDSPYAVKRARVKTGEERLNRLCVLHQTFLIPLM